MANRIDSIKVGSRTYDIDLPPDAIPSISGLIVNGKLTSVDDYNNFGIKGGTYSYSVRGEDGAKYNLDNIKENFYIAYIAYLQNRKEILTLYDGTLPEGEDYITFTAFANIQSGLQNVIVPASYIKIKVRQISQVVPNGAQCKYLSSTYNNGLVTFMLSLERPRNPTPMGALSQNGTIYFSIDFATPKN